VVNLESYLKQNNTLCFLVLREYQCCTGESHHEGREVVGTTESILLVSPQLCNTLQLLYDEKFSQVSHPLFKPNIELSAPYVWCYHTKDELKRQLATFPKVEKDLINPLINVSESRMNQEYAAADDLLAARRISWKYISYLFVSCLQF
jgi:hypothetical protein